MIALLIPLLLFGLVAGGVAKYTANGRSSEARAQEETAQQQQQTEAAALEVDRFRRLLHDYGLLTALRYEFNRRWGAELTAHQRREAEARALQAEHREEAKKAFEQIHIGESRVTPMMLYGVLAVGGLYLTWLAWNLDHKVFLAIGYAPQFAGLLATVVLLLLHVLSIVTAIVLSIHRTTWTQSWSMQRRLLVSAGAGCAALALTLTMVLLAPARVNAELAVGVDNMAALVEQIRSDPDSRPAEITYAELQFQRATDQRDAAIRGDQLLTSGLSVAVFLLGPVSLMFAEGLIATRSLFLAKRASRRATAASEYQDELRVAASAQLGELLADNGLNPDDVALLSADRPAPQHDALDLADEPGVFDLDSSVREPADQPSEEDDINIYPDQPWSDL